MANNTERLIRIYNRLRRGPVTIEVIQVWAKNAGINISTRQLYRDLKALQILKIAEDENVVEFTDEKNRKTWKLEYENSKEVINQFDLNTFMLFRNFIPSSIRVFRNGSLEKFETILYKNLSNNKYQNKTDVNGMYLRKTDWYDNLYGNEEHAQLEDLIWALQNKRNIKIESTAINPSNVKFKEFKFPLSVLPIELLFHRGRVHLTSIEAQRHKLLIFTVDKSLKFDLTNDIFNRKKYLKTYNDQLNARFGIADSINNKIYNIKIEYSTEYGLSLKNFHLHKSAEWKKIKNGNFMLEMKCGINRELVGLIAQGLDKVKVHQPKILKDLILKKLKDSVELYQGQNPNEIRANGDY